MSYGARVENVSRGKPESAVRLLAFRFGLKLIRVHYHFSGSIAAPVAALLKPHPRSAAEIASRVVPAIRRRHFTEQ